MKEEIKEILLHEAKAIENIPITEGYEKALDIIYERVYKHEGKLITAGMGKAGQIALNIATTFSSTGIPSVFIHPSDAQHGDLGVIQQKDVLLVISNSGKTREIIELVELTNGLHTDVPLLLITGNPQGELCQVAEAVLYTGHPKEVCPLELSPTTSTTTMTVIGDVLVVLMMKRINFSAEDYAKRHHGGYLGHKSRKAMVEEMKELYDRKDADKKE